MSNVQSIRFGGWEIGCEPEATRKAYATVPLGAAEKCGCDPCLNFAAARTKIYPAEALELFEKLGIPAAREAEVYYLSRLAPGRHLYGGWFHFVGAIVSGADVWRQVAENAWQPELEAVDENFSLGFSSRLGLVRKSFAGLSLVQLEFSAKAPWVLSSAEPT